MSDQLLHKYRVLTAGISELYTFQKEAITSLLNGQNTLCIAPTGKGKSIIYQLAAQELDGLTIVVSPLTALIKEQVNILREAGVNAIGITSDISFQDQRILLRNFSINPPKILFLSPERLQNSFFRAAILRSVLKVN
jgi:ATP-dependent DNA helicase RecQ